MSDSQTELKLIKSEIRSFLISSTEGVSVRQLLKDYRDNCGKPLPYEKFGFPTPMNFLKSLRDTVKFVEDQRGYMNLIPVEVEKSSHVNKLVLEQKRDRKPKRNRFASKRTFSYPNPYWASSEAVGYDSSVLPSFPQKNRMTVKEEKDNVELKTGQNLDYNANSSDYWNGRENLNGSLENGSDKGHSYLSCGQTLDIDRINDRLKRNFRMVLRDHLNGILLSKFPAKYKEKFGSTLEFVEMGFSSLKELVIALPTVFRFEKCASNDWLLLDSTSQVKPLNDDSNFHWVPNEILDNLAVLVNQHRNGILGSKVLDLYKKAFGLEIDVQKLGFKDVTSFLVFCRSVDCRQVKDEIAIFPKNIKNLQPPALPPAEELLHLWRKYFSEDMCGPTAEYKPFVLPPGPLDYLKVRIPDLQSPSSIWLHLIETHQEIDNLMFDLNLFYNGEEQRYQMDENTVLRGQVCCALFFEDQRWHRAKIIGDMECGKVKVSYVDFGTIGKASLDQLRYLHKKFLEYPVYAVRAALANLTWCPQHQSWPRSTSDFLFNEVFDKTIVAEVISIDFYEPMLEVILHDTNGAEDVCLNKLLVDLGKAIHLTSPRYHTSDEVEAMRHKSPLGAMNGKKEMVVEEELEEWKLAEDHESNSVSSYGSPLRQYQTTPGSPQPQPPSPQAQFVEPCTYKLSAPPPGFSGLISNTEATLHQNFEDMMAFMKKELEDIKLKMSHIDESILQQKQQPRSEGTENWKVNRELEKGKEEVQDLKWGMWNCEPSRVHYSVGQPMYPNNRMYPGVAPPPGFVRFPSGQAFFGGVPGVMYRSPPPGFPSLPQPPLFFPNNLHPPSLAQINTPHFNNVQTTERQLPAVKLEPSEMQPLNKDNIFKSETPQDLEPKSGPQGINAQVKLEPSSDIIEQELKPNDSTNKRSNEHFILPVRHQPQIHKLQFQDDRIMGKAGSGQVLSRADICLRLKKEEEMRRQEEEEKRKRDEETKKKIEEVRKREEEEKIELEEKRKREEKEKIELEEKRKREEKEKIELEEKRKREEKEKIELEEKRKREEKEKIELEEERKREKEEKRKREEVEKRKREEEEKRKREEEKKMELEEKMKREVEEKKKLDEEMKLLEELKKKMEEGRKQNEEKIRKKKEEDERRKGEEEEKSVGEKAEEKKYLVRDMTWEEIEKETKLSLAPAPINNTSLLKHLNKPPLAIRKAEDVLPKKTGKNDAGNTDYVQVFDDETLVIEALVCDREIHLMKAGGLLGVVRDEFVHTYTTLTTGILLENRINSATLPIPFVEITARDYPQLFHQLKGISMRGVKRNTHSLLMIPIKNVLEFIEVVAPFNTSLYGAFKSVAEFVPTIMGLADDE